MLSFPNAKINLGLNILEKRPDGFHNIESVFYPIGWNDVLEMIKSDTFAFSSSGLDIPGDPENNLILVRGAVPGHNGAFVMVRPTNKFGSRHGIEVVETTKTKITIQKGKK